MDHASLEVSLKRLPRQLAHAVRAPQEFYAAVYPSLDIQTVGAAALGLAVCHGIVAAVTTGSFGSLLLALPGVALGTALLAAILYAAGRFLFAAARPYEEYFTWSLFAATLTLPVGIAAMILPLKIPVAILAATFSIYVLFAGCRHRFGFTKAQALIVCAVPASFAIASVAVTLIVAAVLAASGVNVTG